MSNDEEKKTKVILVGSSESQSTLRMMALLREQGHEALVISESDAQALAKPAPSIVEESMLKHYSMNESTRKGANVQGSVEYLNEKEGRLQPLVDKAKAALDKVTADKAADTSGVDARIEDLSVRMSNHRIAAEELRGRADRVDIAIGKKREEIAKLQKDVEAMIADKQHITFELIPAEENAQAVLDAQMVQARTERANIDKKWHKRLHEAEKEHRQLSNRLLRVQLRKPKPAAKPVTPTQHPNGLHTMPGPKDEGHA